MGKDAAPRLVDGIAVRRLLWKLQNTNLTLSDTWENRGRQQAQATRMPSLRECQQEFVRGRRPQEVVRESAARCGCAPWQKVTPEKPTPMLPCSQPGSSSTRRTIAPMFETLRHHKDIVLMSRIQARLVPQGLVFGENPPRLLLSSSKTAAQPEHTDLCFAPRSFRSSESDSLSGYMQDTDFRLQQAHKDTSMYHAPTARSARNIGHRSRRLDIHLRSLCIWNLRPVRLNQWCCIIPTLPMDHSNFAEE